MAVNSIDLVLVTSISILALCFIIFICFVVPVLLQMSRTLEAVRDLLVTVQGYSDGVAGELSRAYNSAGKISGHLSRQFSQFFGIFGQSASIIKAIFKEFIK